jgi:hypothetical protein
MSVELEKIYTEQLNNIDIHLKKHNLNCHKDNRATNPFLICVPENYLDFKNPIMIFGQETNSWCRECGMQSEYSHSLKKSLEIYKAFYLNGGIDKYPGPFWNEFKRIRREVSKSYSAFFIWNNINKIGRMGKGNVAEIDRLQFEHFNVIKHEIKILKPLVFIFLTGHNYDHFIRKNIGEFKQRNISDSLYELQFLGEFSHIKAYKTFHPNALYLKGKNKVVIPNLIELVKKACI